MEVYINNQQTFSSNGLYAHKSYISIKLKAAISQYKEVLLCGDYDYEEDREDITNPQTDPFFTRRFKLLTRPDGFMLYGKLGLIFSQLLNCSIQISKPDCV